jgi:hypothetical protein
MALQVSLQMERGCHQAMAYRRRGLENLAGGQMTHRQRMMALVTPNWWVMASDTRSVLKPKWR